MCIIIGDTRRKEVDKMLSVLTGGTSIQRTIVARFFFRSMCTKKGVHWAFSFDVYICGGGEGKREGGKKKGERGVGGVHYLIMCTLLIKVHVPKVKNAYITH